MRRSLHSSRHIAIASVLAALSASSQAADWSDTYIGYRYGTQFSEPFNPDDIAKHIVNFSHVSGFKYGTNFFNIDLLLSDEKDPSGAGSTEGAQEVYIVYRNTLDVEKTLGTPMKFGPVKGLGLTLGFDANAKTDAGYNSKKRMVVAGPTLAMDVPGFLNVSLLALWESNAPFNTYTQTSTPRFSYDVHPMLTAAWGIPIPVGIPLSFEGFVNFIASKGKNEFGGDTAPETNLDMQIMLDVGAVAGGAKNTFKVGLQYQYWKNKFGNETTDTIGPGMAGPGATAKTPMIRVEYHF
jgi:nucleoside-specific outer membrane channel protein Tsx